MIKNVLNKLKLISQYLKGNGLSECSGIKIENEKKIKDLEFQVSQLLNRVEEGKAIYHYQTAELEKSVAYLSDQHRDCQNKIDTLSDIGISKSKEIAEYHWSVQSLNKENLKLIDDIKSLNELQDSLHKTIPTLEEQISCITQENRDLEKDVCKLTIELRYNNEKLRNMNDQILDLQTQVKQKQIDNEYLAGNIRVISSLKRINSEDDPHKDCNGIIEAKNSHIEDLKYANKSLEQDLHKLRQACESQSCPNDKILSTVNDIVSVKSHIRKARKVRGPRGPYKKRDK